MDTKIVAVFMTFAIAAVTGGLSSAVAAKTQQGWAHENGLIDLQPNGVRLEHDDAIDRLKIQEAFARWGIAYDEGQANVIESLFTDDAVFQVTEGSSKPIAAVNGKHAIAANALSALHQQGDQRRHAISNIVIDRLTQTEARAIAYSTVVVSDSLTIGASVIYSADLRRGNDGVWRFSRLVIGMDNYAGKKPQASR